MPRSSPYCSNISITNIINSFSLSEINIPFFKKQYIARERKRTANANDISNIYNIIIQRNYFDNFFFLTKAICAFPMPWLKVIGEAHISFFLPKQYVLHQLLLAKALVYLFHDNHKYIFVSCKRIVLLVIVRYRSNLFLSKYHRNVFRPLLIDR